MENDKLPSSPAVLTWVQQHQTARAPRKLAPRSDVVCTAQLRQKGNVVFVTSRRSRARRPRGGLRCGQVRRRRLRRESGSNSPGPGCGSARCVPGVVDTESFIRRGRPLSAGPTAVGVASSRARTVTPGIPGQGGRGGAGSRDQGPCGASTCPCWLRLPGAVHGALPSGFGALAGPFGGKTNPLRSFLPWGTLQLLCGCPSRSDSSWLSAAANGHAVAVRPADGFGIAATVATVAATGCSRWAIIGGVACGSTTDGRPTTSWSNTLPVDPS
jgi:hypothetical protein